MLVCFLDIYSQANNIKLQCIGAMTRDEYKKHIESNSILRDDFHPVDLPEHSTDEIIKILKVLIVKYEAHHNVKYMDEALTAAAHLSSLHTGSLSLSLSLSTYSCCQSYLKSIISFAAAMSSLSIRQ